MHSVDIPLYDSGRFPLWFRGLALVFGLGALWLAVNIAAYGLFGISLGISMAGKVHGSPWIGSLASFAIAAAWIFIWFAQVRILFDPVQRDLILLQGSFFRTHERRIPLAGSRELCIRQVRGAKGGRFWRISVEFSDGRSELVTDLPNVPSNLDSLATSFKAATKLPVRLERPA